MNLLNTLTKKAPWLNQYATMYIAWVIVFLSFSSASILVVLSNATAVSCAFWRVFLASLMLWSARLLRGGVRGFSALNRATAYSILAGLFLAVHFLLWMESLFLVPVAVSTTVVVTYPLLSVLIDRMVFKEKLHPLQIVGLAVGFIGVLLFMQPWVLGTYDSYGVLLSFGGAIAAACYFSLGRSIRKGTSLTGYTLPAYTSASVFLLLYALVSGEELINYPLQAYLCFILLALIPMVGGHTLVNYMLRYVKTSVATSIALAEPIGAAILAYFILDQQLDLSKALVMTITLSSVAAVIIQEARSKSELAYQGGSS